MRLVLALLAFMLLIGEPIFAQQAPASPAPSISEPEVDAKLHEDVLKLLDTMSIRANIKTAEETALPEAKKKLVDSAPGLSPEFAEEWAKRMVSDAEMDQYVAAVAKIYEKHFDDYQIKELVQAQDDIREKRTPNLSDELKAKFAKDGVVIQSEIIGVCAQVGAKQGGEIAQQLAKEHPEWVKDAKLPTDPAAKKP